MANTRGCCVPPKIFFGGTQHPLLTPTEQVQPPCHVRVLKNTGEQVMSFAARLNRPFVYYGKRGSASYIVHEVRSVRERDTERERYRERETQRERERERERDRSDVTLVALKLAKSFALFLAENVHLSFSPLKWRWVHTFCCQSVALFETVRILRKIRTLHDRFIISVKCRDRESKHRNKQSNFRLNRPSSHRKKWIKLIPKTNGNRKKRLCMRLCSGDKHHLRKSADRKAQTRKAFVPLTGLICAFRSADFLRWCLSPERNLTHNLFLYFH